MTRRWTKLRKYLPLIGIAIGGGATATAFYVPAQKQLKRPNYMYEVAAANYINLAMQNHHDDGNNYFWKYLQYLESKNNVFTKTSSDQDHVYVKIHIPFASQKEHNNVIPLRLLHGGHYHVVYLDGDRMELLNLENNFNNQNYFTIKIPIWNGELEYHNLSYLNQYVNDDYKTLNLYQFVNAHLAQSSQLKANASFKINPQFLYEAIVFDSHITFFDQTIFTSPSTFKTALDKHGMSWIWAQIKPINITPNSPITSQYIEALRQQNLNPLTTTYYGAANPNDDWQNTYYAKGAFIGRAAYDFAYHFLTTALAIPGSYFMQEVNIDLDLYQWWIKNKPAVLGDQLGIDPVILANANKTQHGQWQFWKAVTQFAPTIYYNMDASKDPLPSYQKDRQVKLTFYGGYEQINGTKQKFYVSSLSTIINKMLLYQGPNIATYQPQQVRDSGYPLLDIDKDARKFQFYNKSPYQNNLIFKALQNTESWAHLMHFKWETMLTLQTNNFYIAANNLVYQTKQDYQFVQGGG